MNKYSFIKNGRIIKKSKSGKVLEKQILPKTDLPRSKGNVFYMCFVFLPKGTQIFTGGWDKIREKTKNLPLSHGIAIAYRGGEMMMAFKNNILNHLMFENIRKNHTELLKELSPCKQWDYSVRIPII